MWVKNLGSLFHVYYLLVTSSLIHCNNKDVLLIVNQYNPNMYFCITNSSSALSWVLEDTTEPVERESVFIPSTDHADIQFKPLSSGKWTYKTSELSEEIIFDRRWEELQTYTSDYVEEYYVPLNYTQVEIKFKRNFDIPLSIRIRKEAHIFLCDGENVASSNCYWLVLEGFSGTKSVIRKCRKGSISPINDQPSKCQTNKAEISRLKNHIRFLNNNTWNHFVLSKKGNKFSFTSNAAVLNFDDNEGTYSISHLIIHSKKNLGRWKFHKINYFNTVIENDRIKLQPAFITENGSICISLFIKSCNTCFFILELSEEFSEESFKRENFTGGSKWREIKFIKDDIKTSKVYLTVESRLSDSLASNTFWSFGYLKRCHKSGFRMISLDRRAECQLITNSAKNTLKLEQNKLQDDDFIDCPEDKISSSCLPCKWFRKSDECGQLEFCEKLNVTSVKCSCSAGFISGQHNLSKCTICKEGFYGQNCKKRCGKCKTLSYCNNRNGTCEDGCTKNYIGSKCNIPSTPMFLKVQQVENINYTTAEFHVTNFKISNSSRIPKTFVVQYKKTTDSGIQTWETLRGDYVFNKNTSIIIESLQPGVNYSVRCIVKSENGKIYDEDGLKIPVTYFKTLCEEITAENILIKPHNTSASLNVSPSKLSCPYRISSIKVDGRNSAPIGKLHKIRNLKPFTDYEILVSFNSQNDVRKPFKTQEGVPGAVESLHTKTVSSTEVQLNWPHSNNINGNLNYYVVEAKIARHLGCDDFQFLENSAYNRTTKNNSITLSNLIPYSSYKFSVFALNTKYSGPPVTVNKDLPESNIIEEDEIPEINSIEPTSRSVKIKFSEVKCSRMRGILKKNISATCFISWCKNSSKEILHLDSTVTLNVSPWTKYYLEISFCRNTTLCSAIVRKTNFETLPETPYGVSDLLAYSKNKASISLRWKAPYPPTGTLELYKIKYFSGVSGIDKIEFNVTMNNFCKLWAEYQCWTITGLKENMSYDISVYGKVEEIDAFGQTASVQVITKIEPSEAPPNLTLLWTLENDLEISWKHPIESNGDIQYFRISVLPSGSNDRNIYETFTVVSPLPVYKYTVKAKNILPTTTYKISIQPYNGQDGNSSDVINISPPDIPMLENEPEFSSTNTTIMIKVSPKMKENNRHKLIILIGSKEGTETTNSELHQLAKKFQVKILQKTVLYECIIENTNSLMFTIGGKNQNIIDSCNSSQSEEILPETSYNITLLLKNTDKHNNSSYKVYSYRVETTGSLADTSQNSGIFALWFLLLLLIIPIGIFIYIKKHSKKHSSGEEYPLENLSDGCYDEIGTETNEVEESKPIPVEEFHFYVESSIRQGKLRNQFKLIIEHNEDINYETLNDIILVDYFDITYSNNSNITKAYVVSTIPKQHQLNQFWKIIWEDNVENIILLDSAFAQNHFQMQGANYWPKKNQTYQCTNISIHCALEVITSDYELRKFTLTCDNQVRLIQQFRLCCSNYDNPSTLIPFFKKFQEIPLKSGSPVLIHSSLISVAGFALVCDMSVRTAKEDGHIDIFGSFQKLNFSVLPLVGDIQLYELIHLVIFEILLAEDMNFEICGFSEKEFDKYKTYLKNTQWIDDIKLEKNNEQDLRFPVLNPLYENIETIPSEEEVNLLANIFHGISVDGFRNEHKFIVTTQPSPNDFGKFWQIIFELNVPVVISLNKITKTDNVFWPTREQEAITLSTDITLKFHDIVQFQSYDWITIYIVHDKSQIHKEVKLFSVKKEFFQCQSDVHDFVQFCLESNSTIKEAKPIFISCLAGATTCDIYLTLNYVISQLKETIKYDICSAIRSIRRRIKIFRDEVQLRFLWEAVKYYITDQQLYETFS